MAVLLFFTLFLSLSGYSSATYCICKDGAQDPTAYQRVIDYACGAGADCRAVQQNGPCYVANNPKAVCDYAVNSYFQNKGQTPEACVFSGAATATNNLPSTVPSGCTFPTSGSPTGTGTGTGGIPSSTPGGMITGTPGTSTPGSSSTGVFSPIGLGPTGSYTDMNPNGSPSTFQQFQGTLLLLTLTLVPILWA
ncbi:PLASMODESMATA CALLOSE-BINDING PROTEIN 4 isoform X1 [Beta vulgaris subsp. vulgaris]|uniref:PLASMODESMATA CALLOSE-BINDING PROTEIN 4 isoform X1 n=1 Tax=Beta vulgaris subsp. vulgaris TaxID=3555 RepID=UPI0020374D32|nr:PLASMODESMATA CALLOSE-BINDING PROTEIN 4 isoform X1 [Beta vulgaris subsp. vulgaris]